MASWNSALRRLTTKMQERTDRAYGGALLVRNGTVTAVSPGASADGRAATTVTLRGATTVAPYLDPYSDTDPPQQGDFVAVVLVNGSPLILGRVRGLPSF